LWTNSCSFGDENNVLSRNFGGIIDGSFYYLEDLKQIYYACQGLPYEKEKQTLFIDNKPNKVFRNPKWNGLFIESFIVDMLLKSKVQ
jgi:hypothetical protein